ncbi:hypothetical protein VKS41_007110 [Umbelopsis sp. WA50703]
MDKAVKAVIWGTIIIGSGYGLMKFTVPNETQMRERLTPELRREADYLRNSNADKREALAERIHHAATTEKPLWDTRESK